MKSTRAAEDIDINWQSFYFQTTDRPLEVSIMALFTVYALFAAYALFWSHLCDQKL